MGQHEFVAGAYAYYADNYYEPGNPEDGEWQECHYPVPKCKGGTLTILLLKQHHAIQGVLQSEEYQHPCIWGWEKEYLPADLLPVFKKWKKEHASHASQQQSKEDKAKGGYAAQAKRTPEERAEVGKYLQNITPEQKKEAALKATKTNLARNPSYYGDLARKARSNETQEVRSARGHNIPKDAKERGRAITNSRKYRCTVTGHVSTAGPLTIYQKKRGIDTKNREPVV